MQEDINELFPKVPAFRFELDHSAFYQWLVSHNPHFTHELLFGVCKPNPYNMDSQSALNPAQPIFTA